MDEPNDAPPPRLVITKMELENFKSYKGLQTIGPFHKCFSAVVGPNGSGKSNVIDAMLFVFGKRAKQLRLSKVSELIHKSPGNMNLEYARVNVYFQEIIDHETNQEEEEEYDIVPGTEMVVSRIAKRDNSSQYKINNRNVQFKDVANFLGSKGIDLDNNRFLILQGEVEMISMMPPIGKNDDGLLEYLEDIIGSNKFVEPTAEALANVEALAEQRQETLNRVKAVETEKNNLVSAKQEAEALLSKDRMIRSKQNVLYQIYKTEASLELQEFQTQHETTLQQLQSERDKYEQEQRHIRELEELYKTKKAEYDMIHAELVQTKEEFSSYERKDIKLREELKHCKKTRKSLTQKIADAAEKVEHCSVAIQTAQENIPILEKNIERLSQLQTEQDEQLQAIQEEVRGKTKELRTNLEAKMKELAPIKQERAVFQAAHDTALAKIKIIEDGPTKARARHDDAAAELANLDETQNAKRTELSTTEKELKESKAQMQNLMQEEKRLARDEPHIVDRHTKAMVKLEDLRTAVQSNDAPRMSHSVKGILQAAKKGGELEQAGILGRLGDLATIADEYDVAISTACPSLDHIVVKTNEAATKCLEFLRRHNLGRASFMVLDKISKGAHDRNVETPEGAPRLFDLIRPVHPSLAPAFFLAVSNTLVAKDLDTATRWCYDFGKRWRVVTLDGKLLETSGTQSGGGTTCRRGRMKLESGSSHMDVDGDDKDNLIQELEAECMNIQRELETCRNRRKEIAHECRTLKKSIRDMEASIPKLTVEINGCDTTRQELTQLLPTLEAQTKLSGEDEQKLKGLRADLRKCEKDMADCTEAASGLEDEVAHLQTEIMEAGGTKLKDQQAACKKTLTELNAAEKSLNSAKVAITSNEKAGKKAENAKAKAEIELEALDTQETSLKEELTSLEKDAVRVQEAFEKVKELESQACSSMNNASTECEALKSTLSNAKCIEIELMGKLEDLAKSVSHAKAKKEKWDGDLDKLRATAEGDLDDPSDSDSDDDEDDDQATTVVADAVADTTAVGEKDDIVMDDAASDENTTAAVDNEVVNEKRSVRKPILPIYDFDELKAYDKESVKRDIAVLEGERNTLAKNANMGAIAEYRKKEADYLARVVELDQVTTLRDQARDKHEDLRRQRLEMFMAGFSQITLKLKEMYQMITLGGDAELELVDSLDPFSEGIIFSVRPPKKSWKNISNLSGGEKTLSSLALVFALHHFKPTPLYVMDEIDAALDFKNVSIVANYIKERTRNAQFIIISLRNNMFELADRLVGIYKTNNCTKSISVDPSAFVSTDKAPRLSTRSNSSVNESSARDASVMAN